MFIKKNSGHKCLFGPCGYQWYPGSGVPGVPVAAIMDEVVVLTFSTWPDLWEDIVLSDIVDATAVHNVEPGGSVLYFVDKATQVPRRLWRIDPSTPADEMFAALMASSPTLVRIEEKDKLVTAGWKYVDGTFHEPV